MSVASIFTVIDMRFIDSTLRFAAHLQRVGGPDYLSNDGPLHFHLASFAIQQMALEEMNHAK